MKKLVFALLVLSMLIVPHVFAQQPTTSPLRDAIGNALNFLFFDLGNKVAEYKPGTEPTQELVVAVRLIFFIIVFALLIGASKVLEGTMSKRTRVIIALALAGLGTLLIPPQLMINLALAYGGLVYALMVLLIVGIGSFFIWSWKGTSKQTYMWKFLCAFAVALAVGALANFGYGGSEGAQAAIGTGLEATAQWYSGINDFVFAIFGIYVVLAIYYFLAMFGWVGEREEGSLTQTAREETGNILGGVFTSEGRAKRAAAKGDKVISDLISNLERLITKINGNNVTREELQDLAATLLAKAKGKDTELKKAVRVLVSAIDAAAPATGKPDDKIETSAKAALLAAVDDVEQKL